MKKEQRPYAGSWSADFQNKYRVVTSWTPDAIVQFNGDTTLPGCPTCRNRIDFSSFINSVSASAGVDGTNGCDIQLKIPKAYGDQIYQDGRFVLTTGIEVNVYYRGFFKTSDLTVKGDNVVLEYTDKDGLPSSEEVDLSKIEARPYYPVFHGFIESVGVALSDNSYEVSIGTRSMFSLWENQKINTNQGYFAASPKEARGSVNLNGHVYTNMTPHQIIYSLFLDSGGSPEGTGFVYSQKSNLSSKIATGQQNYSLYMRYLENRFQNGLYGLRMYGVNGRLYTAMEQSVLVDNTPTGKDNQYRRVVKDQVKPYGKGKKGVSSALNNMLKIGMIAHDPSGRAVRTLNTSLLPSIQGESEDSVNVLSLQPFVTDLGALAQVSWFESNFESKKSIADQVSEKTGYEFYQDFDGDLVFKPPMYNLDTSHDRVYRIRREDIISISYAHAEPEYTYAICSGGPFRNIKGTPLEGEWGIKGMYVDYQLVAKYGWKELTVDTTFYNSARKAFYAAVVALDNANKGTETCDVTIPLRPEIKPGYPLYIEENDCFYYIEAVNHSFSFGGECTTSFTLVAQRKKFIPPGDANVPYASDPARAVDLGNTSLPERFIYTTESTTNDIGEKVTTKKITGFPNVVMALDPTKIDPGFMVYSIDYQAMGGVGTQAREAYRNMLLIEGRRLGIIQISEGGSFFEGPWKVKIGGREGTLGLESGSSTYLVRDKKGRIIRTKKGARLGRLGAKAKGMILGEADLERATYAKVQADEKASKLYGKAKSTEDARKADKIRERGAQALQSELERLTSEGQDAPFTIYDLIQEIRAQRQLPDNLDSTINTANLLTLLADKKNSFAPHIPGYYRYFSSSHPDPEHQGPPIINPQTGEETDLGEYPKIEFDPPGVVDLTDHNMVLPDPAHPDLVKLVNEQRSVKGIFTRTLYTNGFQIVPTKDIKTLTFQANRILKKGSRTIPGVVNPAKWEESAPFGGSLFSQLKRWLVKTINGLKVEETTTIDQIRSKVFASPAKAASGYPTTFLSYTLEVISGSTVFLTALARHTTLPQLAGQHAEQITSEFKRIAKEKHPTLFQTWTGSGNDKAKEIAKLINEINSCFSGNPVGSGFFKTKPKSVPYQRWEPGKQYSPIFPVSDERGYEVFGAYQYGRGLSTAKGSLFDALLKQNPEGILTQTQINELRDNLPKYSTPADYKEALRKAYRKRIDEIMSSEGGAETIKRIYASYKLRIEDDDLENPNSMYDNLVNQLMTRSDEQVITNIPKTLAEIRPPSRQNASCTCKSALSDSVLLFDAIDLDRTRVDVENPAVLKAINEIENKVPTWVEHQRNLRGQALTTREVIVGNDDEGVLKSLQDRTLRDAWKEVKEGFQSAGSTESGVDEVLSDIERVASARSRRNGG
jgi:hypothetical protein